MQSTLYAIVAMMVVALMSLNTQRNAITSKTMIIRNEIESQAVGVAAEVFGEIASLPFDENQSPASEDDLTPRAEFGTVDGSYASAADIDDVHGTIHNVTVGALHGTIDYEVRPSVRYVNKVGINFVESSTPTFFKEVTLTVSGPMDKEIKINRLFSHKQTTA